MNQIATRCFAIVSGHLEGATFGHDELITGRIEGGQVSVSRSAGMSTSVYREFYTGKNHKKKRN